MPKYVVAPFVIPVLPFSFRLQFPLSSFLSALRAFPRTPPAWWRRYFWRFVFRSRAERTGPRTGGRLSSSRNPYRACVSCPYTAQISVLSADRLLHCQLTLFVAFGSGMGVSAPAISRSILAAACCCIVSVIWL